MKSSESLFNDTDATHAGNILVAQFMLVAEARSAEKRFRERALESIRLINECYPELRSLSPYNAERYRGDPRVDEYLALFKLSQDSSKYSHMFAEEKVARAKTASLNIMNYNTGKLIELQPSEHSDATLPAQVGTVAMQMHELTAYGQLTILPSVLPEPHPEFSDAPHIFDSPLIVGDDMLPLYNIAIAS